MIRIINLRVAVIKEATLQQIVEKRYPALRGHIEKIHLVRRAVDARKKPDIVFVYTLLLEVANEKAILTKYKKDGNLSHIQPEAPEAIVHGQQELDHRPVVMGFGPAGLMAAYYLAREGYKPLVLERGQDVDQRALDVEGFWKTGSFKAESNVQFGEGGAGTFSDGKLTTRVTHPRLHEISSCFVKHGAPEEILYKHKPHVGTDILRGMVKSMRQQIIDWGGEVRFGAKVTDFVVEDGQLRGVEVNGSETIACSLVLAGIGHSARDTYEMMHKRKVQMEAKPFAIGVRIEHDQDLIDYAQYGMEPNDLGLGAAEYTLKFHHKETGRAAYSFCMCPGGQVVASASEEGGVVTNGMSLYARDSGLANSAIVVSVGPDDFGHGPLDGMTFQREWERKAFALGGKTYGAPIQTVGDFLGRTHNTAQVLEKSASNHFGRAYSYGPAVVPCDLHDCLPDFVANVLEEALPYWGRRIAGFDGDQVCMTGVETRTSAPLRIGRDAGRMSPSLRGLYPIGEGAGYAGGIMSAALDGAETAIMMMAHYKSYTD